MHKYFPFTSIILRCGPTERRATRRVKKRGAVKDKLFPAFISRRRVAPAMINSKVFFLSRSTARRGAARRSVGPLLLPLFGVGAAQRGAAFGGAVALAL